MRTFIRRLMLHLARLLPSNKTENRFRYPQTWHLMPKRWIPVKNQYHPNGQQKLRRSYSIRILEALCGLLTGHEISETEGGYGGGGYMDRHCRWCDKIIKIPISENDISPEFRNLMSLVGKSSE